MFRLHHVWNYIVKTTERWKQLSLWIIPKRSASLLSKSGYEDFYSFLLKPRYLEPESENTYLLKEAIYLSFRLIPGITQTFTEMLFHLVQYKFLQLFTIVSHKFLTDVKRTEVGFVWVNFYLVLSSYMIISWKLEVIWWESELRNELSCCSILFKVTLCYCVFGAITF
jgi:hypothetical protein